MARIISHPWLYLTSKALVDGKFVTYTYIHTWISGVTWVWVGSCVVCFLMRGAIYFQKRTFDIWYIIQSINIFSPMIPNSDSKFIKYLWRYIYIWWVLLLYNYKYKCNRWIFLQIQGNMGTYVLMCMCSVICS